MTPLSIPFKDLEFIRDFAAFCRTKGDERYNFFSVGECAVTQFLHTRGIGIPSDENPGSEWVRWHNVAGGTAMTSPWTFSALADRLEALLVDAPVDVSGRLGLSADRAGGPAAPNPVPGFGPDGRSSTGAGDEL